MIRRGEDKKKGSGNLLVIRIERYLHGMFRQGDMLPNGCHRHFGRICLGELELVDV